MLFCQPLWLLCTSRITTKNDFPNYQQMGVAMKKIVVALAVVVASLSLAGCFVGKAPPPIATKG